MKKKFYLNIAIATLLVFASCKKKTSEPETTTPVVNNPTPTVVVSDTTIVFNVILYKGSGTLLWYSPTLTVKSNAFQSKTNLANPGTTSYATQCSQPYVAYSIPMKKGVIDTIIIANNHPSNSNLVAKYVFNMTTSNPIPVLITNSNFGGVCNAANKVIFLGM